MRDTADEHIAAGRPCVGPWVPADEPDGLGVGDPRDITVVGEAVLEGARTTAR